MFLGIIDSPECKAIATARCHDVEHFLRNKYNDMKTRDLIPVFHKKEDAVLFKQHCELRRIKFMETFGAFLTNYFNFTKLEENENKQFIHA